MLNTLSELKLKPLPRRNSLAIDEMTAQKEKDGAFEDDSEGDLGRKSANIIYQVCSSRGKHEDDEIDSQRSMPEGNDAGTTRQLMMINTCLKADSKVHNNEDPTARNIPLGKLYDANNYASNGS